ncbi:MAG: DUF1501 domain-containing protein [Planctomycetota bacterium]|nr:MAG: DUF1501 domain-containing protein [Planctomycetota bacterium]
MPPSLHGPGDRLPPLSRREALLRSGMGMGWLGAASLMESEARSAGPGPGAVIPMSLAPRPPHFAPRARAVIHLFANGGPSHLDTFDRKIALEKYAGQEVPGTLPTERRTGAALPSPFPFRRYGQSGLEISDLFPSVARHADRLLVVRSMHAEVPNHEPSLMLMNCGDSRLVRPAAGAWVTYGLGTENQNLPGFVAMCPGGYPIKGTENWRSAFLPGAFQGTYVDTNKQRVEELVEHVRHPFLQRDAQRRQFELTAALDRRHLAARPHDPQLEARLASMELAWRMQSEASEAFDISRESQHVRDRYGDDVQGRQMLIARRLVERGVRYVQVWHGAGQPWDSHDEIAKNHGRLAKECDRAIGALLDDLVGLGLLDSTLVFWGGEFGRTPTVELPMPGTEVKQISGRDHNHHGFTVWMAGGGVKGGTAYGATDELGFKAVENPVHVHDLQATILHLLGLDHTRLTFRHSGRDYRLTDVHGRVIADWLA